MQRVSGILADITKSHYTIKGLWGLLALDTTIDSRMVHVHWRAFDDRGMTVAFFSTLRLSCQLPCVFLWYSLTLWLVCMHGNLPELVWQCLLHNEAVLAGSIQVAGPRKIPQGQMQPIQ